MLATTYRRPRTMRLAHVAEPEIEHPNDAIVRVTRTCICGSDIHIYNVDDMAVHLKKMTDWLGADVCIDAVGCDASGSLLHSLTGKVMMLQGGSAIALHWAINSARKGGRISIVGVYGPTFNAIPIGNAMNKSLTLRMNQASVKRQ